MENASINIIDSKGFQIYQAPVNDARQTNYIHDNESNEDIIVRILKANSSEFEALFSMADEQYSKMDEKEVRQKIQIYVNQEIDSEEKKKSFIERVASSVYNIATSFVGAILLEVVKMKAFGM